MEANEDKVPEELMNFLSIVQLLGVAKEPTEDMAKKVDAIFN